MASWRQRFPNSCGATSLMCAAIELGVNALPASATHPLWVGGLAAMPDPSVPAEIMIYAITGGATGVPTNATGYSMPSRIARVCALLGLNCTVYLPHSVTAGVLLLRYPGEIAATTAAGGVVVRAAAPALAANQRKLRILRVGATSGWFNLGLHYVMERPNGEVMDPALGWDHASFAQLQTYQAAFGEASYVDTGISIVIG